MGLRASAAYALAAILSAAQVHQASAASACSNDTFSIEGKTLAVQICDAEGHSAEGTLQETFTVAGRPALQRSTAYRRTAAATTRTIDDVALGPLGIGKTLHVTIAVRPGGVRLERALLIPGAIPLK